jgi:hypothetical protein
MTYAVYKIVFVYDDARRSVKRQRLYKMFDCG